jgi:hypothetical protein
MPSASALSCHGDTASITTNRGSRSPSYTHLVPSTECCISTMSASSPGRGFVAVRQGHLQHRVAGSDEVGLHADPTVGIVEAVYEPIT